jgi:hypothetical protein
LSSVVANSLSSWAGICAINNDLLIHIPYKLHTISHTHTHKYIYMHVYGQCMHITLICVYKWLYII